LTREALEDSIRKTILEEVKEGLRYLTRHSEMHFAVKVYFLLMAALGAVSCVAIIFIQEIFGTATRDLGVLGMFLAGGLFLGILLFGRFGQKMDKKTAISLSFIANGAALVLFAVMVRWYPALFIGGLFSALIGITISPVMASTNTLIHETVPEETRGRIFSSLEAVIHLAFLAFMFLTAYMAKFIDSFWILVGVGVVLSLCGIIGVGRKRGF
jgi:MFS family permease